MSLRRILDYFPLALLIGYSIIQWVNLYEVDVILKWQNYLGIILLIVNILAFFLHHQWGVIITCLICLLGLFGLISLTPGITTGTIGFAGFSIVMGDLSFIIFLLLHLVISNRWHFGILTKSYWRKLLNVNKAFSNGD